MSRIIILGANGQLARHTTQVLLRDSDASMTLFLRKSQRLRNPDASRVKIVDGDVLDLDVLSRSVLGHDVVYANLAGRMKEQAENIVSAMTSTGVKRLIFISSMGIYDEVPGETHGAVLTPYRDATKVIEASSLDYTVLRPGWFTHDARSDFRLTQKGQPFEGRHVSLNALASLITKLATEPALHVRESLGVSTL